MITGEERGCVKVPQYGSPLSLLFHPRLDSGVVRRCPNTGSQEEEEGEERSLVKARILRARACVYIKYCMTEP